MVDEASFNKNKIKINTMQRWIIIFDKAFFNKINNIKINTNQQ